LGQRSFFMCSCSHQSCYFELSFSIEFSSGNTIVIVFIFGAPSATVEGRWIQANDGFY
jgi:hypothetical protein